MFFMLHHLNLDMQHDVIKNYHAIFFFIIIFLYQVHLLVESLGYLNK